MTSKITLPAHMGTALDQALDAFAKDGFLYDITSRQIFGNKIVLQIVAHPQEIIDLGIKIGYRLAK
jgi:hypothetical protein